MKDKNWKNYTNIYSAGFLEENKGNEFHSSEEDSSKPFRFASTFPNRWQLWINCVCGGDVAAES
jgi:hypothetical protein